MEAAWLAAGAQEHLLPVAGRDLQGKQHSSGNSVRIPWNKISSPEETAVLAAARESPEWSSRQLVPWITDHLRLSLGESTVYRLLKREWLVKLPDMQLLAGKESQRKTSGPNQMWATDASYLRASYFQVGQLAIDATSMTEVPREDRTRLLSDNGPGYVSRDFQD